MSEHSIFGLSLLALRNKVGGPGSHQIVAHHTAMVGLYRSREEALGAGLLACRTRYPVSDGYYEHKVDVVELTSSIMASASYKLIRTRKTK